MKAARYSAVEKNRELQHFYEKAQNLLGKDIPPQFRFIGLTRKSKDLREDETSKSTEKQIKLLNDFVVKRLGCMLDKNDIFSDEMTGGELFRRDGYRKTLALLRSIDAKSKTVVLLVWEDSRFLRDDVRTLVLYVELFLRGILVYSLREDRFIDVTTTDARALLQFHASMNQREREIASERVMDEFFLNRKDSGESVGGFCYGYRTVAKYPDAPKSPKKWVVNKQEADIIARIILMRKDGHGRRTICRTLNGDPECRELLAKYFDGVPPVPPKKAKGVDSWKPGIIRFILQNTRYAHGYYKYGVRSKIYRKVEGVDLLLEMTRRCVKRSALSYGEAASKKLDKYPMVKMPVPTIEFADLQNSTVEDIKKRDFDSFPEFFKAVMQYDEGVAEHYRKATQGKGYTFGAFRAKSLLSNIAHCSVCGAPMVLHSRPNGKTGKRNDYYQCKASFGAVKDRCVNRVTVRREVLDHIVLREIAAVFSSAKLLIISEVEQLLAEQQPDVQGKILELQKKLRNLEGEVVRLRRAIKMAKTDRVSRELMDELDQCLGQQETLGGLIKKEEKAAQQGVIDNRLLMRILETNLANFAEVAQSNVPYARKILQGLLKDGKMQLKPDYETKTYTVDGELLTGNMLAMRVEKPVPFQEPADGCMGGSANGNPPFYLPPFINLQPIVVERVGEVKRKRLSKQK